MKSRPASPLPLLGAHVSIAGGVHNAIGRAAEHDMTAIQIFTRSSRAWAAPPLAAEDAERFREGFAASPLGAVVAHASYLLNLASPDEEQRVRSERALADELLRCDALSVPWLVLHPGSATGSDRDEAIARAGAALGRVIGATKGVKAGVLVENSAGQGDSVGTTPEEMAAILAGAGDGDRLGACLDTCHAFSAGYDLRDATAFDDYLAALDEHVGLARIEAIHVNDSKKPLGARVDRHEGIGKGEMGLEPFRRLVHHAVLRKRPLILETPKGRKGEPDLDAVNLRTLRELAAG